MRRETYSGRNQIFSINGAPLLDVSDDDDAVLVDYDEDMHLDPAIGLYGEGQHVENARDSGLVTIKIKSGAVSDLRLLQSYAESKAPISAITGRDLTTQVAGFLAQNCVIQRVPAYQRGKNPGATSWAFRAIHIKITHDGPRISPV